MTTEPFDWTEASKRLAGLFARRAMEIRRDVPASEIVEMAFSSLVRSLPEGKNLDSLSIHGESPVIDPSGMKGLIDRINEGHRSRIIAFAESIGELCDGPCDDDSLVFVRTEGIAVGIKKDDALKYLALGSFPPLP